MIRFLQKYNDKRDGFDFDIVNFPFLDGDVPLMVYISQLNRMLLTLIIVSYQYHKLCKTFSKFYRRHFKLIEKYHVGLKKLMQQGIYNPEFYGDLVYKFKKLIGNPNFSDLFKRIVNTFKRAGYTLDMRQTACLVLTQSRLKAMLHSLVARRLFRPQ